MAVDFAGATTRFFTVFLLYSVLSAGWGGAADVASDAGVVSASDERKPEAKPASIAPERNYSEENRNVGFDRNRKKRDQKKEPKDNLKPGGVTAVVFVVIVGIGCMLWFGLTLFRKFFPGGRTLFSCSAMEVLGRTHIEQQKYLALVRVGKRLLVLGVSPDRFDRLGEIEDEDEVADVMAVAAPKNTSGKNLFHRMFQKQIEKVDGSVGSEQKTVPEGNDEGLGDIQARIRSLREQE